MFPEERLAGSVIVDRTPSTVTDYCGRCGQMREPKDLSVITVTRPSDGHKLTIRACKPCVKKLRAAQ